VGDDAVLRDIQLKPDSAQPRRFTVELRGLATTQPAVSQFVLRLQQIGLFDDVKLLRTGREPVFNTSAVSFEITCVIGEGGKRP
jgi:hypothetical protein